MVCGDTVRMQVRVESTRLTSKGSNGVVVLVHSVLNQRDEEVVAYRSTRLIAVRPEQEDAR